MLGKPELYRWYGKHGYEKCEQIKRESGEFGTNVHAAIGDYLLCNAAEVKPEISPLLEAFKGWKEEAKFEPVEVEPEAPYRSQLFDYQGTFDAVGLIDGELVMCDWKTSNAFYPENALQLAAYAWLYEEKHHKPVRTGIVVRLDKKTLKAYDKTYWNLPFYFDVFKSLLPVYDYLKGRGKWA